MAPTRLSRAEASVEPLLRQYRHTLLLALLALLLALSLLLYWHVMRVLRWCHEWSGAGAVDIVFENNAPLTLLTIDDAPYTDKTFLQTLNALYENGCTATFFINNFRVLTDVHRELLVRAVRQGNHLANHGEMHRFHALLSEAELYTEITNCQLLIDEMYDQARVPRPSVKFYRPTWGIATRRIQAFCAKHGYRMALGSNFPSDPRVVLPALNQFYVERHYSANDIIILHDRPWTPELLRNLLQKLKTYSLTAYSRGDQPDERKQTGEHSDL